MLVVIVDIQVKKSAIEAFREASLANASASLTEPGVARFDLIQQQDDPTRFCLIEVYRDESAPAAHKVTAHYQAWRDAVEPLMARPRSSRKFTSRYPPDSGWETPDA